jgi:hypothetical protein
MKLAGRLPRQRSMVRAAAAEEGMKLASQLKCQHKAAGAAVAAGGHTAVTMLLRWQCCYGLTGNMMMILLLRVHYYWR